MRTAWLLVFVGACAGGAREEAVRPAASSSSSPSSAATSSSVAAPQESASTSATPHVVVTPSNVTGTCDDPTWWLAYLVTLAKTGDARELAFVARQTSTRSEEIHRAEDALAKADASTRARAIADAEAFIAKNRPGCAPPFSPSPRSQPWYTDAGVPIGWLEPRVIQHLVRASFGHTKLCYTEALRKDPSLSGQVRTKFVIALDGTVSKVEDVTDPADVLKDAGARECVRKVFTTLVFPPPEGGVVTVVYPLIFAPSD
jgi:hypothetical protein